MADVNNPPPGGFSHGGWYWDPSIGEARQYNKDTGFGGGTTINNPEQQGFGQRVSPEVQQQSGFVAAQDLQSPVSVPFSSGAQSGLVTGLTAEVEQARKALEDTLNKQQEENDTKMADLRAKETQTVEKIGELTTPFREDLENAERERLYINENFEANQELIRELDTLLTEGNELIRQQKEITGLAAVRNPRIQKAMDDVAARAGVIEAVINARNGQIAQAQNLIDRSINAITADRQDQITYYSTILNLANRDILLLDADSKRIAQEQLDLKKGDLKRAQATADFVKQLLLDPATASLMGEAGVKLTDSVQQINAKITQAEYTRSVREFNNELTLAGATPVSSPSGVPSSQLVSYTDSQGKVHYYKTQAKATTSGDLSSKFLELMLAGGGSTSNAKPSTAPIGPYRPGDVWVDPQTGIIWEMTVNGWRML